MVEKRIQKLSEPSLESQESNKTNKVQFRLRMTKNNTNKANYPNCHSSKPKLMNRMVRFANRSRRLRKDFEKISEPSLQSQGFKKINGVQFLLRMPKNQHKRSKLPKLPFQQNEFNEPVNLVSQPVQTVERRSKNLSDPSSRSNKSKKINKVENQLRMTENRHKQRQRPELLFQQTEFIEPANLVSQPVHPVERGSKNLSDPSSRSNKFKKTNQV